MPAYELFHCAQQSEYDDEVLPLEENRIIAKVASPPQILEETTHSLFSRAREFFCRYCQRTYLAGEPAESLRAAREATYRKKRRRNQKIALVWGVFLTVILTGIWWGQIPILSAPLILMIFVVAGAVSLGVLLTSPKRPFRTIVLNRYGEVDELGRHELRRLS